MVVVVVVVVVVLVVVVVVVCGGVVCCGCVLWLCVVVVCCGCVLWCVGVCWCVCVVVCGGVVVWCGVVVWWCGGGVVRHINIIIQCMTERTSFLLYRIGVSHNASSSSVHRDRQVFFRIMPYIDSHHDGLIQVRSSCSTPNGSPNSCRENHPFVLLDFNLLQNGKFLLTPPLL